MSYDLAVWEGERPRGDEHAGDVLDALQALYRGDDAAPTPLVAKFVEALEVRWPGSWTPGSLLAAATGPLLYFAMHDAIVSDAAFVARTLGLVCFDPQVHRMVSGEVEAAGGPWVAVVGIDPGFFAAHGSYGFDGELPAQQERHIPLTDVRTRIGRFSRKHVVHPQIDLSIAPADPWVSRAHADLVHAGEGRWWLEDLGSEHGVYLNDGSDPVPRKERVALAAGDSIRLGRWTVITIGSA